jgi:hypothetical protein
MVQEDYQVLKVKLDHKDPRAKKDHPALKDK